MLPLSNVWGSRVAVAVPSVSFFLSDPPSKPTKARFVAVVEGLEEIKDEITRRQSSRLTMSKAKITKLPGFFLALAYKIRNDF